MIRPHVTGIPNKDTLNTDVSNQRLPGKGQVTVTIIAAQNAFKETDTPAFGRLVFLPRQSVHSWFTETSGGESQDHRERDRKSLP
jgi:hypothetical protein